MLGIILAGGLGTRLSHLVTDVPKPMALVSDKPFLQYLFDYLIQQNMQRVIVCVGHKHESITQYFGNNYKNLQIDYCFEEQLLGTGGAIKHALDSYDINEKVLVLNGDAYFPVDIKAMHKLHQTHDCLLTLALKHMSNSARYGSVVVKDNLIAEFQEKSDVSNGLINGGIYLLSAPSIKMLRDMALSKFSWEYAILTNWVKQYRVGAYEDKGNFIDIGIPEDYQKAQQLLPLWSR